MSAHAHRTKCCKNVIRKLHNNSQLIGLMALLQTFRNIKKILQFTVCATGTNTHKLPPKHELIDFCFTNTSLLVAGI